MNLFRRRSSVDLGRYEGPLAVPVAPVSVVVEEGAMIARSAVRMAVKNRMIVAALRDDLAYDHDQFVSFAVDRFAEFATQEEASAERVRQRRSNQALSLRATSPSDLPQESARREEIHTGLGLALRALASDTEGLDAILGEAREDALAEITAHATIESSDELVTVDEEYSTGKSERVAALLFIDLSELAANAGTSLQEIEQQAEQGEA